MNKHEIEPWTTMILSNKFILGFCYNIQKYDLFLNILEGLRKYQNIFYIFELPKLCFSFLIIDLYLSFNNSQLVRVFKSLLRLYKSKRKL